MSDKVTVVLKEKTIDSQSQSSPKHEESKADSDDKKDLTTDTNCGVSTSSDTAEASSGSLVQDKQNIKEATRAADSIDDELALQSELSNEETFKDAIDSEAVTKSDGGVKSSKSETLFSDIESSDDSIGYDEPKKIKEAAIVEAEKTPSRPESPKIENVLEEKKVIESEFDPVESDEEFFEDALPGKPDTFSQDTISKENAEEEKLRSPLDDDDKVKPKELNLDPEEPETDEPLCSIESNLEQIGSPEFNLEQIDSPPEDEDLVLESSVDPEDQIEDRKEIATSDDLAKDNCTQDDGNDSLMEETVGVCSPISEIDTFKTDTKSAKLEEEEDLTCQKLEEDLKTVEIESSESSNKVQVVSLEITPPETSTSIAENKPTEVIESEIEIPNEEFGTSEIQEVQKLENDSTPGEKMETDLEITKDDSDEKMEENLSIFKADDTLASELEEPQDQKEEESMQVDETILEISGCPVMETNEDVEMVEELDSQLTEKDESKKLATDEENIAETDERLKEEPVEDSTESSKIVEKLDDPTEATSEDLIETEKEFKCQSIVIQETKSIDRLETSPKASVDDEIQETAENKDEIEDKIDDTLEFQEEGQGEHETTPEKSLEDEKKDDTETRKEGATSPLETTEKSNELIEEPNEPSEKVIEISKKQRESQEEPIDETKEQNVETEEKIRETVAEKSDVHGEELNTKIEDVVKSSEAKEEKVEKSTESKIKPTEKEITQKETNVPPTQLEAVKEKDSNEKVDSSKESQDIEESKESEEVEPIKTSEAPETPEVAAKVVVKEVVVLEIGTSIEIMKPKEAIDSGASQNVEKSTVAKAVPEIIEIDDDDDIEETKKAEDNSKTIQKESPSINEKATKESEDKKTDEVSIEEPPLTPMEINQDIPTEQPVHKIVVEDQSSKTNQGSGDDATMKDVLDDEDEPLLMIDTSHKEDNDTESNVDNETATSAPSTDSSSDGSLEVFYDKECVNYECKRATKNFYRATVFSLNYFKVSKKRTKTQFVCEDCYERSLSSYEELCSTLKMKQPLLHGTTFKCQEFVEIIDSSDEEESDSATDKVKVSDENTLPKDSIEMLEAELEGAIRKVMHNVDIQKQLSWTKQILQQRLTNLQEDSDFVTEQLRSLQRKADQMHNSLYQCPKIKLRQLTPLDLNSGRMYNPESDNSGSQIPLPGDIIRNPICVNESYYAVKTKAIASWVPCKVIEEVEGYPAGYNHSKTYKIKFTKLAKYPMFKTVYAKHMAYFDPPNVRLPIGSRVIAYFDATSLSRGKEKMLIPSAFYPGIIAEPLKQSNKYRYLVFYDDGYFQYVSHKDVRLVCQASENVWEDVHHQSREFIHNYLTQYAVNRPMVQTQKGQSMLVDYNGKWIYARVIDVDCSLVQMLFEGQSRSEWIYRGSTRLGPVYKESNNLSQKNTLNATRRRTEPFIRYINGDDSSTSQQVQEAEQPPAKAGSSEIRSVAKKSVSRVDNSNNNNSTSSSAAQPVPTVRHLNNSTIFVDDDNKPKGKVVYYTARKNLPPRNYVPHICNPSCPFNITHNLSFYSPLAKPLLSGWERQVFRQKSKKFIIYRGPCGKRMRNIEELHRYLRVTDNELNVDNFDFSPDTNCLAEYVLEKCLVNKKDISCGKEKMPIPCVNYYDETMPPACEYSAERIPTEGVPLNLDEEFLCGCDCTDDCSDKTKCACWQLTYAGAKYGMPTVPIDMVGYQYKRLYEHVPTGIYECNSRCKCKANCVNRVVQQPLQSKLQVFKTSNRGWGLRCINDVPRGSFICVYAGQMLTEQVANEGGLDAGDEYFAELDYIEVAEQIKEGYESDVQEPEEDEDLYNPERDDDDIDFRAPGEAFKDREFNTRLRTRRGNKNSTDGEFDSQERQVISFEPNKNMDTSTEPNEKPTIRKLFGKDESCYVMDAKVRGNLGRYFNHSCSPNLFVQNVFVDTHDLRFPWVAFFASTHIRAGTELTWNYNYEVGVVPGKVLYCQCGAPNCRQRLL
ncbi:histone-lysine N-methyltransferase eggless [Eupeodes corollae]|uniref:histone-lysine N-methyltransferase eggless n=1 Tax=Eupeodes corollae TaxID=290404 RepID=UPI00248F5B5B|nr:histone-lysine N-methyltransferase eggless [Eupeodes corollae]